MESWGTAADKGTKPGRRRPGLRTESAAVHQQVLRQRPNERRSPQQLPPTREAPLLKPSTFTGRRVLPSKNLESWGQQEETKRYRAEPLPAGTAGPGQRCAKPQNASKPTESQQPRWIKAVTTAGGRTAASAGDSLTAGVTGGRAIWPQKGYRGAKRTSRRKKPRQSASGKPLWGSRGAQTSGMQPERPDMSQLPSVPTGCHKPRHPVPMALFLLGLVGPRPLLDSLRGGGQGLVHEKRRLKTRRRPPRRHLT